MSADKIIAALFITLLAGSMISAHINQGLRVELARLEEQRLDAMGCVGFVSFDPETIELTFYRR